MQGNILYFWPFKGTIGTIALAILQETWITFYDTIDYKLVLSHGIFLGLRQVSKEMLGLIMQIFKENDRALYYQQFH